MRNYLFISISLFFPFFCHAQSVQEEIEKINKFYADLNCFEMRVTQLYYEDVNQSAPTQQAISKTKVYGSSKYYKSGDTELFLHNDIQVIVDHDGKLIAISPYRIIKGEKDDPMEGIAEQIQEKLKTCGSSKIVKIDNKISEIRLSSCSVSNLDMVVSYRSDTHQIVKVTTVKDGLQGIREKSIIKFDNFVKKSSIPEVEFNANKYLTKTSQGTYSLKAAYDAYQLLDMTNG